VKFPVPVPSLVLLFEIVGVWLVLQHTPLKVTGTPPSEVTCPPLEAPVSVTLATDIIVTVGIPLGLSFLQLKNKHEDIARIMIRIFCFFINV